MIEYYIDAINGDDSNDGSQASPLKTVKQFLNIAISNTTDDCYVYLMDGTYYLDFCSMPDQSFKRIAKFYANLYFIGTGLNTILVNTSFYNNNMTYYYSSMKVYFRKMVIEAQDNDGVYIMMCYINQYYQNVLFRKFSKINDGHFMTMSGYETKLINCTIASGTALCLSTTHGGNVYVEKCYGYCILTSGDPSKYHRTDCVNYSEITNNATEENGYKDDLYKNYGVYAGEYRWGEIKLLIIQNSKIYTITDNSLEEITEDISSEIIKSKGISIEDILENISLLEDQFELISNKNFITTINNTKTYSELIVASNNFSTKIAEHIDYFKSAYEKNTNSSIKLAFSIDNGVTWLGNNFEDLSVEIPLKPFSELTEEERTKWNTAKETIATGGIAIEDLESLDFNTLDFEYIRFAYVLSVTSADDICNTTKLQWQFDAKGSMQLMDSSEVDIEVISDSIKITPKTEEELIKVNITNGTCDGVGGSSDIEDVSQEDLNELLGILD